MRGGKRVVTAVIMSRFAAASFPVTSPILPREKRKRTLPRFGEQAFRGELLLQPLESGEVVASAEALDRQRAQLELALGLEELGPSVDVHALAVQEVEPSASNWPRRIDIGRDDPSVGSFNVRKTFAQALWRLSSVTSPSIQIVGKRAIQSATPRLNDATV